MIERTYPFLQIYTRYMHAHVPYHIWSAIVAYLDATRNSCIRSTLRQPTH